MNGLTERESDKAARRRISPMLRELRDAEEHLINVRRWIIDRKPHEAAPLFQVRYRIAELMLRNIIDLLRDAHSWLEHGSAASEEGR